MALIQCDECGKEISDKAISCPGCGVPRKVERTEPTPHKRPTAKPPIELESGKWSWGGMEFNSLESANMFAKSRQSTTISDTSEHQYDHTFPDTNAAQTKKMGPVGWVLTLGIAAVIGSCVFGGSSKKSAPAYPVSTDISDSRALSLCKQAIRLASRDPDKAEIPYARSSRVGPDWVFYWSPGSNGIRLRNGLGLDVPANARCAVNAATGQLSKLDVNGNTIVN